MVRLLTLVVAVWLVSFESCYGQLGNPCSIFSDLSYKGEDYEFNVEKCNTKMEEAGQYNNFAISNPEQFFGDFNVKIYGSHCSSDESFFLWETINETHKKISYDMTDGIIFNDFMIIRAACYHSYVKQVSMSERCSIEAPAGWDFNVSNPTWQEDLYNRIDCNCTWGCNITSALPPESEEKDESFPLWAILIISIGGAIILGMAVYFLVKKGKANIGAQIERVPKGSLLF